MAAVMRIAAFVFGGELSPYGRILSRWVRGREGAVLFTDNTTTSETLHYLRFAPMHAEQPFDVLFFDINDTVEHAALFPIVTKHPGVLFYSDIGLWRFARSVSHEPRDPWGTGWIFNAAAPDRAEKLVLLAERDIDPGRALETSPLATALALRSAGAVVQSEKQEKILARNESIPPVNIIDDSVSEDEFAEVMERLLPVWQEESQSMNAQLKSIEHPFQDLFAVEIERLKERYGAEPKQLSKALKTLRELFDGATNSASVQGREGE